jgi:cyclomaltodextrinase / maltogenic alpha-amylase / neopullulanase
MRRYLLLACVALAFVAGNGAVSGAPHGVNAAPPASIEVASIAAGRAKVTFAHRPARAESAVFLAGEFNGWNPNVARMERMGDGFCRATLELSDGRYEYKFVVDGKWIADPDNPEKVPDGHDGFNSVLVLGKSAGEMPTEQRVVEGFVTPDWARDAIWYQIMLDRFANGDPSNDPPNTRPWQSAWTALSPWESQGGQTFWEWAVFNRHYGGDLAGLRARIPYLRSLGVNAIYLNPVFEAPSPHKYDAANFVHIDDNFGVKDGAAPEDLLDPRTWALNAGDRLFLDVVKECKAAGLRVIVDGVFNHVGDQHVAFLDVRQNGAKSRYAEWFRVRSFEPFAYDGWAGFGQLPEFAKSQTGFASDAVRDHIFAVTRRWMDPNGDGDPSDGVDGWRLDVPNEVPARFWSEWRALVKKLNPDAYIVGEIWKRADGWLDGTTFDAVMNYQFAQAVVQWAAGEIKPSELDRRLAAVRLAYPEQATAVLQNLLDSHDTDRLVSMIANPGRGYDRGNSERPGSSYKGARPSDEAYRRALLAVAVQMTYVGAPMIWYGDEVGMWGSDDPFCRKPMLWADLPPNEDPDERIRAGHLDVYRALIKLRNDTPALRRGAFKTLVADGERNLWVFERRLGDEVVVVALNGSREPVAGVEIGGRSETLFVTDGGSGTGGDDARTVPAFGVRIMRVP